VPDCPECRTAGAVRVQQVLRGTTAIPVWVCTRCETEWPVDPATADIFERRLGTDRRTLPRHDQRDRRG
jgi:hypothetical protein